MIENVGVLPKETFITSVKKIPDAASGHRNVLGSDLIVIDEIPAMAIVRQKHAQLHEVVGSLSDKISAVLAQQERDFLAAYRAHMFNVQKELYAMREKIHRNETVENKSEKIKKIEDERDWYRNEALRLDAFTTTMTKDLKTMKENLESIEEDRTWLEKQLKACKKQNKVLRAELDVRVAVAGTSYGSDNRGGDSPFDSQRRIGANLPKRRISKDFSTETASVSEVHGLPQLTSDAVRSEEKLKKQIRHLKRELQQKSIELSSIMRQHHLVKSEVRTGRSLLESFFLLCVESVKEEVSRRRERRSHTKQRDSQLMTSKAHDSKHGVELTEFTSQDRVRVIERLLAHDEVLTFLHSHLFPSELPTTAKTDTSSIETNRSSRSSGSEIDKVKASLPTLQISASLPDTSKSFSIIDGNTPDKDDEIEWIDEEEVEEDEVFIRSATRNSLPLDRFTKKYLTSIKTAFIE
ncbi:hypothetical protein Plhal304r1_c046g0127541 [Plasmopara halstedii]